MKPRVNLHSGIGIAIFLAVSLLAVKLITGWPS